MKPETSVPEPAIPVVSAPTANADREFLERIDRILAGQEPPPLMSTPPEVLTWAEQHVPRFKGLCPEDRRKVLDDFCLQYHYGGQEVLIWQTSQGVAVLAVGLEQIGRVLNHLSPEKNLEVLTLVAHPWW